MIMDGTRNVGMKYCAWFVEYFDFLFHLDPSCLTLHQQVQWLLLFVHSGFGLRMLIGKCRYMTLLEGYIIGVDEMQENQVVSVRKGVGG